MIPIFDNNPSNLGLKWRVLPDFRGTEQPPAVGLTRIRTTLGLVLSLAIYPQSHCAATFGTRGAGRHEPDGGKTAAGTSPNPGALEKGVGKEWSGKGIPADFCDKGAGKWRDL